jgi:chromosome segregation ATPase
MLEKENALVNQNNDNQKLLSNINLMTKELDLMKRQLLEKEQLLLNELKASNQSEIHRESNAVSEGLKSSNEKEIRYKEEEIESYKNEISQLNKQIGNLNEEKGNSVEIINKLRKDFKEKVDIVKDLNLLIDKHESEKKALEEQLLVVKSIALSLERELDETRQNLSSSVLNNQKGLSFADYGVDSESVKAESSELKKLSAELVFVESALRSKERELLSALQDGASAAGQISGLNLVIQDMAQEIESLKRENASLEKRLHSQKGVHDILKYDIDNSEKLYQKVLEENESKDKTIILLNDEIKLIKQELKENDAELVQKSKALFENQNNFSNLIEELIEYSHWILTTLSYPEDMLTEFTKSINSNKVKFGNHPISEIISLSKIKVKDSISTLLANSNSESLSLKDKELNDLRNKLEEAYSNIKRQVY